MTELVVAPHPDDEVLGCGGTIRGYANEGRDVHLCIVTEGYTPEWSEEHLERRPDEIEAAVDTLGISTVHKLGYPAAKLDTVPLKAICDDLTSLIQSIDPDTVFMPHGGDLHRDHTIVHEASLVACRPHNGVDRVLAYETISETEWGDSSVSFDPTVYVDISDTLNAKIRAMNDYDSELREYPHPRSERAIRATVTKRGSEAHLDAAEAFELVRKRE